MIAQVSAEAFHPYDNKGKGKGGGGHPIVPEPSTYGLILIGMCLIVLVIKRIKK